MEIKERKIYQFICEKCQKERRQTFRKSRAQDGLCRACRRVALTVHKNQLVLI